MHMCNDLGLMYDLEDENMTISIGDGRKLTTTKIGKYKGTITDLEGNSMKIMLTNVSYVPELSVNLFSLTTMMEKDFSVTGTKAGIKISKGTWKVHFNIKFGTLNGHVFGAKILSEHGKENEKMSRNHVGTKPLILPAITDSPIFNHEAK